MRRLVGALSVVGVVVGSTAIGLGAATSAAAGLSSVPLGQVPELPPGTADLGGETPGAVLKLDVVLRPSDQASLSSFLQQVYDPSSAEYHHFVSAGELGPMFGAAPSTVGAVDSVLSSLGLSPRQVTPDDLIVPVTTTVGAAESAFGVQIDRYRLPSGRVGFADTAAPQVPSSIAGLLVGIVGLTTTTQHKPLGLASRPHLIGRAGTAAGGQPVTSGAEPDASGPKACSTITGYTTSVYTATQLATAYGFASGAYSKGALGAGETVALFELASFTPATVAAYEACYGISTTVTKTTVTGGSTTTFGTGSAEVNLDIDDVAGLAPDATIDVFVAPNTTTALLNEYQKIATTPSVRVVSSSWGMCEQDSTLTVIKTEETIFEEMAARGESMMAAAGDDGSEDCYATVPGEATELAVDDPASDPWVTGVGGLDLTKLGPPPTESVWNERASGYGAGGGGISEVWPMPTYQKSVALYATSSGTPCKAPSGTDCREVPDVSASADPYHGDAIVWDDFWLPVGGTSAASPLWAAVAALADERCGPTAKAGLLNPALYAHESDLGDVTAGTNTYTGNHGGRYKARTGYDMASGLGAPTAALFTPGVLCTKTAGVATVPAKPSKPTATAGNAKALVAWAAPTTGGSPITSYTVTSSPTGKTCTWSTGPLTCTVSGLTNGKAYTFRVRAQNVIGTSSTSTPSGSVTPKAAKPSTPAPPDASAGNKDAVVTWSAPTTGGSKITRYTVTSSPGKRTCTTTGALTCTVRGLTNGTTYTFSVVARNSSGTSPASTPSNSVTPEPTKPAKPKTPTVTAGDALVTVTWTKPTTGGSAITRYTVASTTGTHTCTWTKGSLTCKVTGLTNGQTYTFTVVAHNAVGTSTPSTPSEAVTPKS